MKWNEMESAAMAVVVVEHRQLSRGQSVNIYLVVVVDSDSIRRHVVIQRQRPWLQ